MNEVASPATGSQASSAGAPREPSVELVIVAYRSRPLVEGLLATLAGFDAVLVDNSSGSDGLDEFAAAHENLRYLDGGGVGFARAANAGARSSDRDFLVFVNPDTRPEPAQIMTLLRRAVASPQVCGVSGLTVDADGRPELGGGWEPSLRRTLVHAVGAHVLWPTAGLYARPQPHRPIDLDWVSGACLVVPREDFLALGGFDEQFFVYSEDVAFGRRVRESGRRQVLDTDVLVVHQGAGSGDAPPRMFQMRGASMRRYLAGTQPTWRATAISVVLSAGTLARSAVAAVRGRRALAGQHLAYIRGVWLGGPQL